MCRLLWHFIIAAESVESSDQRVGVWESVHKLSVLAKRWNQEVGRGEEVKDMCGIRRGVFWNNPGRDLRKAEHSKKVQVSNVSETCLLLLTPHRRLMKQIKGIYLSMTPFIWMNLTTCCALQLLDFVALFIKTSRISVQFVYKSILMLKVTMYVSMTLQTIYTEVCSHGVLTNHLHMAKTCKPAF